MLTKRAAGITLRSRRRQHEAAMVLILIAGHQEASEPDPSSYSGTRVMGECLLHDASVADHPAARGDSSPPDLPIDILLGVAHRLPLAALIHARHDAWGVAHEWVQPIASSLTAARREPPTIQ